jgi:hypothetical protein
MRHPLAGRAFALARRLAPLGIGVSVALGVAVPAAAQSVRVVDAVSVGAADSEAAHHFEGRESALGDSDGKTWRSATGWLSYSLRIYDDSPLTIVCVVAGTDGASEAFDVVVDGRKSGTFTRGPSDAKASELALHVKFADTEGKRSVVVSLAAHPGSRTARLIELRTVQEHLE